MFHCSFSCIGTILIALKWQTKNDGKWWQKKKKKITENAQSLLGLQVLNILTLEKSWENTWKICETYSKSTINTAWKVSVFGVFLVRILLHSYRIRRDISHLFVFIPNTGKYGPEKLRIQTCFTHWKILGKWYF